MYLKAVAILGLSLFGTAAAAQCSVTIEGNDQMQFNLKEIVVPADCSEFEVTLKHVGQLPKTTMGHGWVLTKASDMQAVSSAGMAAGLDNNHVPPGDARVIANTNIIGGGESSTVKFSTSALEAGGDYTFFCPFPGHFAVMQGKLKFG